MGWQHQLPCSLAWWDEVGVDLPLHLLIGHSLDVDGHSNAEAAGDGLVVGQSLEGGPVRGVRGHGTVAALPLTETPPGPSSGGHEARASWSHLMARGSPTGWSVAKPGPGVGGPALTGL